MQRNETKDFNASNKLVYQPGDWRLGSGSPQSTSVHLGPPNLDRTELLSHALQWKAHSALAHSRFCSGTHTRTLATSRRCLLPAIRTCLSGFPVFALSQRASRASGRAFAARTSYVGAPPEDGDFSYSAALRAFESLTFFAGGCPTETFHLS